MDLDNGNLLNDWANEEGLLNTDFVKAAQDYSANIRCEVGVDVRCYKQRHH